MSHHQNNLQLAIKDLYGVGVICKSGRLDCLCYGVSQSALLSHLAVFSEVTNESLRKKANGNVETGRTDHPQSVVEFALRHKLDFLISGPEEPLAAGVVDALAEVGIPCVGPVKELAQLESSKVFTRQLLAKHGISGNPEHRAFKSLDGIEEYLRELQTFVVKPDGLTGGKGVKVFGDHFSSIEEGLDYCQELFAAGQPWVLIEEKLDGEEFSLQSFCDGRTIVHTVPVQDHKRVFDGDRGPNTGGMGSYSCADHLLPFLTAEQVREAEQINEAVGAALLKDTGIEYKGILYGGFIVTKDGLRVIEYNARFGDPEVMNVLPLLENDFLEVCVAIINGTLDKLDIRFKHQASVCKYVVPQGYPNRPVREADVDLSAAKELVEREPNLYMFYGAVDDRSGSLRLTGSRAVAFVGIGNTLLEAERLAEAGASTVVGPVHHRKDIGTAPLISKRIMHMRELGVTVDGPSDVRYANGM